MSSFPSITNAFKTVIPLVETDMIRSDFDWGTVPKKVYFMHGTIKELTAVLQSYTNSPTMGDKKFPLVALIRDVREELVVERFGFTSNFKARIIIATLTEPTLRADDREARNFIPILHPILDSLLTQISYSRLFGMPKVKDLNVVKWDCYFYGTREAGKNIFNDNVDAIEVESITLSVKTIC